jgi:hypothetical protein
MNAVLVALSRGLDGGLGDTQTVDETGCKTLDAKVMLNYPCPVCYRLHEYRVADLSGSFGAGE